MSDPEYDSSRVPQHEFDSEFCATEKYQKMKCVHGHTPTLCVYIEGFNNGTQFLGCPLEGYEACAFDNWLDDEWHGRARSVITKLVEDKVWEEHVFDGRHIRWKTMRVNSEQRWLAYKDTVAESLDKALELFAIKTNVPNLLDLNRVASSIVEAIPAPINEEANIEPLSCVDEANEEVSIEHEPLVEANDEHDDDENDGNVLHDNNLGDLDKYNLQETMDHSIPYSRGYASESDDDGPDEVDEEGFTAKEAEAFTKVWPLLNPTRQKRSGGGEGCSQ
ncbi:hypothetical protein D1007_17916 [Hordeum vulgare]|nr:hypothetical protein D1007_17916 [Hordeum vulgare]